MCMEAERALLGGVGNQSGGPWASGKAVEEQMRPRCDTSVQKCRNETHYTVS